MKSNIQNVHGNRIHVNEVGNILLVDTETCRNDRVIMEFAYMVVNDNRIVVEKKSYIIKEVWENDWYRKGIYAIDKLARWQEMLDRGESELISVYRLYDLLDSIIIKYQIDYLFAYNVMFDKGALKDTSNRFKTEKYRSHLVHNLETVCLWNTAQHIYCTRKYMNWCLKNNIITEKKNIRSGVESVFAYLTDNPNFIETHHALEDLEIEYLVLLKSVDTNKDLGIRYYEVGKNGSGYRMMDATETLRKNKRKQRVR